MSRRIGLFGGSFDPIHRGHIAPVLAAKRELALDLVLFLPTGSPPHKTRQTLAPPLARFAMVELALLDQPDLQVSAHELTVERPSYTVETLEFFAQQWPEDRLFYLVGGDSFAELPTWRRYQDLVRLAELIVMVRPGSAVSRQEVANLAKADAAIQAAWQQGRIHAVEGPALTTASRDLRRQMALGADPGPEEVPALVLDYIRKYRLYRSPNRK